MKAFEKWWKAHKESHAQKCIRNGTITPTANNMKMAMEALEFYKNRYFTGYIAALEWCKKKNQEHWHESELLAYDIQKELDGEE